MAFRDGRDGRDGRDDKYFEAIPRTSDPYLMSAGEWDCAQKSYSEITTSFSHNLATHSPKQLLEGLVDRYIQRARATYGSEGGDVPLSHGPAEAAEDLLTQRVNGFIKQASNLARMQEKFLATEKASDPGSLVREALSFGEPRLLENRRAILQFLKKEALLEPPRGWVPLPDAHTDADDADKVGRDSMGVEHGIGVVPGSKSRVAEVWDTIHDMTQLVTTAPPQSSGFLRSFMSTAPVTTCSLLQDRAVGVLGTFFKSTVIRNLEGILRISKSKNSHIMDWWATANKQFGLMPANSFLLCRHALQVLTAVRGERFYSMPQLTEAMDLELGKVLEQARDQLASTNLCDPKATIGLVQWCAAQVRDVVSDASQQVLRSGKRESDDASPQVLRSGKLGGTAKKLEMANLASAVALELEKVRDVALGWVSWTVPSHDVELALGLRVHNLIQAVTSTEKKVHDFITDAKEDRALITRKAERYFAYETENCELKKYLRNIRSGRFIAAQDLGEAVRNTVLHLVRRLQKEHQSRKLLQGQNVEYLTQIKGLEAANATCQQSQQASTDAVRRQFQKLVSEMVGHATSIRNMTTGVREAIAQHNDLVHTVDQIVRSFQGLARTSLKQQVELGALVHKVITEGSMEREEPYHGPLPNVDFWPWDIATSHASNTTRTPMQKQWFVELWTKYPQHKPEIQQAIASVFPNKDLKTVARFPVERLKKDLEKLLSKTFAYTVDEGEALALRKVGSVPGTYNGAPLVHNVMSAKFQGQAAFMALKAGETFVKYVLLDQRADHRPSFPMEIVQELVRQWIHRVPYEDTCPAGAVKSTYTALAAQAALAEFAQQAEASAQQRLSAPSASKKSESHEDRLARITAIEKELEQQRHRVTQKAILARFAASIPTSAGDREEKQVDDIMCHITKVFDCMAHFADFLFTWWNWVGQWQVPKGHNKIDKIGTPALDSVATLDALGVLIKWSPRLGAPQMPTTGTEGTEMVEWAENFSRWYMTNQGLIVKNVSKVPREVKALGDSKSSRPPYTTEKEFPKFSMDDWEGIPKEHIGFFAKPQQLQLGLAWLFNDEALEVVPAVRGPPQQLGQPTEPNPRVLLSSFPTLRALFHAVAEHVMECEVQALMTAPSETEKDEHGRSGNADCWKEAAFQVATALTPVMIDILREMAPTKVNAAPPKSEAIWSALEETMAAFTSSGKKLPTSKRPPLTAWVTHLQRWMVSSERSSGSEGSDGDSDSDSDSDSEDEKGSKSAVPGPVAPSGAGAGAGAGSVQDTNLQIALKKLAAANTRLMVQAKPRGTPSIETAVTTYQQKVAEITLRAAGKSLWKVFFENFIISCFTARDADKYKKTSEAWDKALENDSETKWVPKTLADLVEDLEKTRKFKNPDLSEDIHKRQQAKLEAQISFVKDLQSQWESGKPWTLNADATSLSLSLQNTGGNIIPCPTLSKEPRSGGRATRSRHGHGARALGRLDRRQFRTLTMSSHVSQW